MTDLRADTPDEVALKRGAHAMLLGDCDKDRVQRVLSRFFNGEESSQASIADLGVIAADMMGHGFAALADDETRRTYLLAMIAQAEVVMAFLQKQQDGGAGTFGVQDHRVHVIKAGS